MIDKVENTILILNRFKILLNKYIIYIIFFGLLLIPIILLPHFSYISGGDDTRLYFIFPEKMIRNFAVNIVTNNSLGSVPSYQSQGMWIPILLVISVFKLLVPFLNTQLLLFTLNTSLGFLFMYLFIGIWVKDNVVRWAKIIAALMYVFSTYFLKSAYSSQLLMLYLVWVIPACLYFFVRSVKEKRIEFAILTAVIYSFFSSTLLTVPWFTGFMVPIIPILLVLFWKHKKTFIFSVFVLIMTTIFLNFYWLIHLLIPVLFGGLNGGLVSYASSSQVKNDSIGMIKSLLFLNGPYHQIGSYLRSSWNERYGMQFNQSIGYVLSGTVLLGGYFASALSNKLRNIYFLALICLVTSMMFVTPNFGDWNTGIFIFLNNSVPFFAMFRNMYDKFSFAMAFNFAFTVGVSLAILKLSGRKLLFYITSGIICFMIFMNSVTLYTSLMNRVKNEGFSGMFNEDFNHLVTYISNNKDDGRYLWLPLNTPSYVVISDAVNPNRFYYGSTPLQIINGISDYTGSLSFATQEEPDLNSIILSLLREKKYQEVGSIFRRLNVHHIIVNKEDTPEWGKAHLTENGEFDLQTPEFYKTILGTHIRDFGNKYSLYKINNTFANETIFLTESVSGYPDKRSVISYSKFGEGNYKLNINNLTGSAHIVFQEPFNPLWVLRAESPGIEISNHRSFLKFSNVWDITIKNQDSVSKNRGLVLEFIPSKFKVFSYVISVTAYIISVIYILYSVRRRGMSK